MQHSQQPSIDILDDMIYGWSSIQLRGKDQAITVRNTLRECIMAIKALPQEPTTYKYSITKEIIEEWQSNTDISKWEMHTFWNFINNKTK